jgi:hypothetical protein
LAVLHYSNLEEVAAAVQLREEQAVHLLAVLVVQALEQLQRLIQVVVAVAETTVLVLLVVQVGQ